MAWIVHGSVVAQVSPSLPGTGELALVLAPTSIAPGLGTSSRSADAAGHRRVQCPRGQPDHRREIGASHQWLSANLIISKSRRT
jgi:hypothetical protein